MKPSLMTLLTFPLRFCCCIRSAVAFGALLAATGTLFAPVVSAQSAHSACIGGSGAFAVVACEHAVRSDPDDAGLYLAWVNHLLKAARIDEADAVLQKGLGRFPSHIELRSRVAVIKNELAEQKYLQERKRARASSSRSAGMVRRDQLKCRRSSGDPALAACDRLIEDDRSDKQALARKALILAQTGRLSEATGGDPESQPFTPAQKAAQKTMSEGMAALSGDDVAAAIRKLRPLAEQGYNKAQCWLGIAYSQAREDREAAKWFRLSAMQGDTGAQMLLADAYHSGRGVLMDAAMAYAWVNLSLAKFHAQDDAANIRKHFSTDMPPSQIAEGQKLSRELCAKIPNCTK